MSGSTGGRSSGERAREFGGGEGRREASVGPPTRAERDVDPAIDVFKDQPSPPLSSTRSGDGRTEVLKEIEARHSADELGLGVGRLERDKGVVELRGKKHRVFVHSPSSAPVMIDAIVSTTVPAEFVPASSSIRAATAAAVGEGPLVPLPSCLSVPGREAGSQRSREGARRPWP